VQVAVSGSLMTSAFEKERPTTAMRKDVDAVVGPYRS
jgi:hypothetical protein